MQHSKLVRTVKFLGTVLFVIIFIPIVSKFHNSIDPSTLKYKIYTIGFILFGVGYFLCLVYLLPCVLGSKPENNNEDS